MHACVRVRMRACAHAGVSSRAPRWLVGSTALRRLLAVEELVVEGECREDPVGSLPRRPGREADHVSKQQGRVGVHLGPRGAGVVQFSHLTRWEDVGKDLRGAGIGVVEGERPGGDLRVALVVRLASN